MRARRSVLALGACLFLVGGQTALANHGTSFWGSSGTPSIFNVAYARCSPPTSFSAAQVHIPAPWSVATEYPLAENESQMVFWTSRLWWRTNDGAYGHTEVTLEDSEIFDWHWAWIRQGDYRDQWMVAYPERLWTGGAAYPAWSNLETGLTDPADLTLVADLDLTVARVFVVEEIMYWGATSLEPAASYTSGQVDFTDGLATFGACAF